MVNIDDERMTAWIEGRIFRLSNNKSSNKSDNKSSSDRPLFDAYKERKKRPGREERYFDPPIPTTTDHSLMLMRKATLCSTTSMEGGTKAGFGFDFGPKDVRQLFTRFTKSDAVRPALTLTVSVSLSRRRRR